MVAAFRRHTLLQLDDCLYAPQPSITHLTRPSLHQCLQQQAICACRISKVTSRGGKGLRYPIGPLHIDIAKVRTGEGKPHLCVVVGGTRKFAVAKPAKKANRKTAQEFSEHLLEAVPYNIRPPLRASRWERYWLEPNDERHPVSRAAARLEHCLFVVDAARPDL